MTPGVLGSVVLGEIGRSELADLLLLKSCVTGRIVVPLVKGGLAEDLGVRGLCPSELWAPGDRGEEIFELSCTERALRSKLGTAECLNGIFDGNRGSQCGGIVSFEGKLGQGRQYVKYRQGAESSKEEGDQPDKRDESQQPRTHA